ncbi:MAG: tRNA preQ1(34) S-adenosylmethionine ribosyltransferase-isomerase QueA [Marivibrio sp.]|uniref:tRNA preQ1(34) S-adenosylmethionine ribosyltransferase-isomerase QueA n=1 Tax=Marivibrio sp. TaxID=2039719 RepID=UPI0032EFD779
MRVADFDFDLPPELIAQAPAEPRDSARLLHVPADGGLADRGVRDLPDLLRPGDLMVVNDTKVIPTRLFGRREGSGGRIEATLVEEAAADSWIAYCRPAKRLKPGDAILFADGALAATVGAKDAEGRVRLSFNASGAGLREALWRVGSMPLPPYIKRAAGADPADRDHYQTVFAREEGAVAAPTAGLHFTPALLQAIEARGVRRVEVTLHVGAGTFAAVKAENVADHKMHSEWARLTRETARAVNETRAAGGRVLAIGTTAMRTLESAAAASAGPEIEPFEGDTDIFITPGYRFRAVDLLLTNFHLPKSTLFMLVSAFSGLDRMKAAYAHAVAERYRFFSYGDACLLERAET